MYEYCINNYALVNMLNTHYIARIYRPVPKSLSFFQLAQSHREFYKDKSGERKPVSHFQLPSSNVEMIREKFPL